MCVLGVVVPNFESHLISHRSWVGSILRASPNKVLDATYKAVLAELRILKMIQPVKKPGKIGILALSAARTKTARLVPAPRISG